MATETTSSTAPAEAASNDNFQVPWIALLTSFLWAISPVFIRLGLAELPSPLWGVAIGLSTNVIVYGILLLIRWGEWRGKIIARSALYWQFVAGIFVGLATWFRWIALDTVPVAVVTAMSRLSVPIVIALSLVMLDQAHERVNWRVWLGGMCIVAGALLLTFYA